MQEHPSKSQSPSISSNAQLLANASVALEQGNFSEAITLFSQLPKDHPAYAFIQKQIRECNEGLASNSPNSANPFLGDIEEGMVDQVDSGSAPAEELEVIPQVANRPASQSQDETTSDGVVLYVGHTIVFYTGPALLSLLLQWQGMSYFSMVNAFHGFWHGCDQVPEIFANCSFDSKIPHMASQMQSNNSMIDNAYSIYVNSFYYSKLSGAANTAFLLPAFLFAERFGKTKELKYLVAALACAATSIGALLTEEKFINQYAQKNGYAQGYNVVWSYCAYPPFKCGTSPSCDYSNKTIPFWNQTGNPYKDYRDNSSLKWFLQNFGLFIPALGCAGIMLVLGFVFGTRNANVSKAQERDRINAANPPSGYGSINNQAPVQHRVIELSSAPTRAM